MAAAWGGPVAWRWQQPAPAALQAEGRRCAGEVIEAMDRQGHLFAHRRFERPGAQITVTVTAPGQPPIIEIRAADVPRQRPPAALPRPRIWVPRGFVVLPASDSAPLGWGLPVLPADDDPLAAPNLRPGLDPARWTPGGPCGEVLLTRVPDAGYTGVAPSVTIVPLVFDHETGPRPPVDDEGAFQIRLPPVDTVWLARRLEFEDFRANDGDTLTIEEREARVAEKRALFDGINALRADVALPPLTPPVRGYFDSAQATADLVADTQILGHYGEFAPGWRTPEDRMGRDGIGRIAHPLVADDRNATLTGREAITANLTDAPVVIGTDPDGQPILDIAGGGPPITGAQAVEHIEGNEFSLAQVTADELASACIGIADNVAVVHAVARSNWIATGNRQWIPADPALPTLSWFGADGINLEGETYPIQGTNIPTAGTPEGQAAAFAGWTPHTLTQNSLVAGDGYFWFRYVTPLPDEPSDRWSVRPMFDRRIFARGRCIAIAPGLVWAAAIRRRGDDKHELVALCHHADDEPANPAERLASGLTSILRVWRCTLSDVAGLGANPEAIIRGVRDASPVYPWDEIDNPWAWTGGDAVDVGTTDGTTRDLLAYASQWEFAPDGQAAVCCRVWGRYPQSWRTLAVGGYPAEYLFGGNAFAWNSYGFGVIFDHTPRPGVLRLDLTDGSANVAWLGFNVASVPVNNTIIGPMGRIPETVPVGGIIESFANPTTSPTIEVTTDLCAVGWTSDGALRFCLIGWTNNTFANPTDFSANNNNHTFYVAFTDSLAATTAEWRDAAIEYGCVALKEGREHLPVVSAFRGVQVLDIARRAFIAYGTVPRFYARQSSHQVPGFSHCWVDNDQPFFGVNAWVDGTRVMSAWHANPDNLVVNDLYLCFSGGPNGTPGDLTANRMILSPSWARSGSDWILSYTMRPQIGISAALGVIGDCPRFFAATPWGEVVYQDACTPRVSDVELFDPTIGQLIGTGARASFASESALVAMSGITGDRPHFLFTRGV